MKNLRSLLAVFALLFSLSNSASAQGEENRNKIEMKLTAGGKTVTAELSSLSTSLNRDVPEMISLSTSNSAKEKKEKKEEAPRPQELVYLSMEVKRISNELLQLISKKQTLMDGTITITDTYGKLPTRTFSFKDARLAAYSEQSSAASYGDSYGSAYLSVTCPGISINGIQMD